MRVKRQLVVVLLALAMPLLTAGTAAAATIIVRPGESIQAAVDRANPGDTIRVLAGTYRETVVVAKNAISIRGQNAVLVPGEPNERCFGGAPEGFCVLGQMNSETAEVLAPVRNVSISGFTIRGFDDTGILAVGARKASFSFNRAVNNGEYGIAAFDSAGTQIAFNETSGTADAGIYVGDSPQANVSIINNDTHDNLFGVFLRNTMHGSVYGNRIHGNCTGVLVLADAPGPAGFYDISGNDIVENDKACPPGEGPPLSGVGVLLLGAKGNTVHDNEILDNTPTGPSAYTGGVVVAEGLGGTPPTNNLVEDNVILRNEPDIFWDETGTGNVFRNNECETSQPPGLCT